MASINTTSLHIMSKKVAGEVLFDIY